MLQTKKTIYGRVRRWFFHQSQSGITIRIRRVRMSIITSDTISLQGLTVKS